MKRLIVGISGASGAIYGVRLLQVLRDVTDIETHLVMSQAARQTLSLETDFSLREVQALADVTHDARDLILSISSFWFSLRYAPISSMVIPSIPGAPLFAFTLLKALLRLPFSSISSKSSGCALSLSFHIRRKERCALTYPSRSALSLCEQLSLFSVPNVLSSFPSCTKDSC